MESVFGVLPLGQSNGKCAHKAVPGGSCINDFYPWGWLIDGLHVSVSIFACKNSSTCSKCNHYLWYSLFLDQCSSDSSIFLIVNLCTAQKSCLDLIHNQYLQLSEYLPS